MNKAWHERPSKLKYRSIQIDILRDHFGQHLPHDKQYWSICGQGANGKPNKGTEIGQLEASGILSRQQYVGVNRFEEIIADNRKAYPEATWITGEFDNEDITYFNVDASVGYRFFGGGDERLGSSLRVGYQLYDVDYEYSDQGGRSNADVQLDGFYAALSLRF